MKMAMLVLWAALTVGCGAEALPPPEPSPPPFAEDIPAFAPAQPPRPEPPVPAFRIDAAFRGAVIYIMEDDQQEELRRLLRFNEWTAAEELPAMGLDVVYAVRSGDDIWFVNPWDDRTLIVPSHDAPCYFAPEAVFHELAAFLREQTPLPGAYGQEAAYWHDAYEFE
jgi:hypothetical protein